MEKIINFKEKKAKISISEIGENFEVIVKGINNCYSFSAVFKTLNEDDLMKIEELFHNYVLNKKHTLKHETLLLELGYTHVAKTPWNFCETPEEKCTMNYCDENGCQNRDKNFSVKLNKKQLNDNPCINAGSI